MFHTYIKQCKFVVLYAPILLLCVRKGDGKVTFFFKFNGYRQLLQAQQKFIILYHYFVIICLFNVFDIVGCESGHHV
jgi:hypothetical protein